MTDSRGMVIIEPKSKTKFTHSEAMEYYNEASRLLEKYRPVKPSSNELPFINADVLQSTAPLSGIVIVPACLYWFMAPYMLTGDFSSSVSTANIVTAGIILNTLPVFTAVGMGILSWNGNPKKKIRSFLSEIFLTRKAKKKIELYRKRISDYENSVKLFEIYVQNTRKILDDSGVMKALDESSGGNVHYYITEDGYTKTEVKGFKTPVIDSKESLDSSQKISGMARELVQSISVKRTESNVVKVKL